MRSYAASEFAVLRKLRVPNMLPFLFTALKVGATLAFIGAIVGEYFGGTSDVLGRVVLTAMSSGSYDLAWAGILIGAVGAIIAYLAISWVERFAIPWHSSLRAEQPQRRAQIVDFARQIGPRGAPVPLSCRQAATVRAAMGDAPVDAHREERAPRREWEVGA